MSSGNLAPPRRRSHARSMSPIRWHNTRFLTSVADARAFPDIALPQVAVVGRSNVGKSSLLNALFGRKGLARVSKRPGHTRRLNLFVVDERMLLVDLPGYGFSRAGKHEQARWAMLIEAYLQHKRRPHLVLLLLDVRHGPTAADLQLVAWLNAHGLRWLPVATKVDKLSGNLRVKRLREMRTALGGLLAPLPTSTHSGFGIEQLRACIERELA